MFAEKSNCVTKKFGILGNKKPAKSGLKIANIFYADICHRRASTTVAPSEPIAERLEGLSS